MNFENLKVFCEAKFYRTGLENTRFKEISEWNSRRNMANLVYDVRKLYKGRLPFQILTRVALVNHKHNKIIAVGDALCNAKDHDNGLYSWREGRRIAINRALENLRLGLGRPVGLKIDYCQYDPGSAGLKINFGGDTRSVPMSGRWYIKKYKGAESYEGFSKEIFDEIHDIECHTRFGYDLLREHTGGLFDKFIDEE